MRFNEVIEHEVITDLLSEPVTLADLKRHLNMLFETEGSYEFNDDDDYLTGLITASRKYLERYTGLSFGPKVIVAVVRNELGGVELPYGPVIGITSVKDEDGEDVDYKATGLNFKRISSPQSRYLQVTYSAGYETLPEDLQRAILEECAFRYSFRGGEEKPEGYCKSSLNLSSPYKRSGWLV